MEQAKKNIREFLEREKPEPVDSRKNSKVAINNLLWMYLPSHITIEQGEALAVTIDDMLYNPEKYLTL